MPKRLPTLFALSALSLFAGVSPGQAVVMPAPRPPAVPPLPSTSTPPQSKPDAPASDTVEIKRDAPTQNGADIALAGLAKPIDFARVLPMRFVLTVASAETSKPVAKGEQDASAQVPAGPTIAAPVDATPVKPAEDLAKFLPDIELKDISQDAALGYHASYAPLPSQDQPADEPPAAEVATIALPDIAPKLQPTVAFGFDAPLALYVGGIAEDDHKSSARADFALIKPRPRPEGLVASIDARPSDPEKIAPQAEPVFRLRR